MLEKSITTVLDPSLLERPQEARSKSDASVFMGLGPGGQQAGAVHWLSTGPGSASLGTNPAPTTYSADCAR